MCVGKLTGSRYTGPELVTEIESEEHNSKYFAYICTMQVIGQRYEDIMQFLA